MGDRHIPIEFANGASSEAAVRLRALARSMEARAEASSPVPPLRRIPVVALPAEAERVRFEVTERPA